MKTTHVLIGVAAVVAAWFAYQAISKSAAQRRVDGYGSGDETPPPQMVWTGSAWVAAPPVGDNTAATLWVPPAPPPPPPSSVLTSAQWAAVNASTAKIPPLGTTSLLPSELATLQFFNPPA